MTSIQMPQLGETIIEGTILKWLKAEGDTIDRDEPLFEISTDKVDTEVPSPVAGTVTKILVQEGATVPVGTELAEIDSGEAGGNADGPAPPPGESAPMPVPARVEVRRRMGHRGALSPRLRLRRRLQLPPPPPAPSGSCSGCSLRSAPAARRRRRPLRPRLLLRCPLRGGRGRRSCRRWCGSWRRSIRSICRSVAGTGTGGRITKHDVLAAVAAGGASATPAAGAPVQSPAPAPTPAFAPTSAPAVAGAGEEIVPMSKVRKLIAEHMHTSLQVSARAWNMVEVDFERIVRVSANGPRTRSRHARASSSPTRRSWHAP